MVGEWVLLKVSPMKIVIRIWKKGKFSLRFIGSFDVLRRTKKTTSELALPLALSVIHLIF